MDSECENRRLDLTPLELEWAIETGGSNLQLYWIEDAAVHVSLTAFLGIHVPDPKFRQVEMRVSNVAFLKIVPAHSDGYTLDPTRYTITSSVSEIKDPREYLEAYASLWKETGHSPMPGIYEALESDWAKPSVINEEVLPARHIFVDGREAAIELRFWGNVQFSMLDAAR